MTAVREAIFANVQARLAAIAGVAEVERMPTSDPVEFPALHIFDGGQTLIETEAGASRYDLTIFIEGFVEQPGGTNTHALLNDLYAATVAALLTEPPLDGIAETIDEGDFRPAVATLASARRMGFSLDFTITFPTRRDDPAQSA